MRLLVLNMAMSMKCPAYRGTTLSKTIELPYRSPISSMTLTNRSTKLATSNPLIIL